MAKAMSMAERVDALIHDCLNGKAEGAMIVEGIVQWFGFSPAKIAEHKEDIRELLDEMSPRFHLDSGGGCSFLSLPFDKNETQWGEQANAEALYVLGAASGMASFCMPRSMWNILPGGMPYIVLDTAPVAATGEVK